MGKGILDTIADAASTLLGGGQTTSSGSGGYGSWFSSSPVTPRKEDKTRDTGIFGFGSNDQYKPVGSTINAYGTQHKSTDAALKHLDRTMCYSGTLICPICRCEKSSPSKYNKCLQEHEKMGYDCKDLYL